MLGETTLLRSCRCFSNVRYSEQLCSRVVANMWRVEKLVARTSSSREMVNRWLIGVTPTSPLRALATRPEYGSGFPGYAYVALSDGLAGYTIWEIANSCANWLQDGYRRREIRTRCWEQLSRGGLSSWKQAAVLSCCEHAVCMHRDTWEFLCEGTYANLLPLRAIAENSYAINATVGRIADEWLFPKYIALYVSIQLHSRASWKNK